jgi:hypothetical protein
MATFTEHDELAMVFFFKNFLGGPPNSSPFSLASALLFFLFSRYRALK